MAVTYGQLRTDERFSDLTSEWISVINARLRLALSGLIFENCFVVCSSSTYVPVFSRVIQCRRCVMSQIFGVLMYVI